MGIKAIGYVRVSTEEQASDGVSLEAQKAKIRAYADLYDIELVAVIEDAGESAKTLSRPGLQEALKSLREGKAEGLLIAKLDRLSRSVVDWNHLIDGYFGEKAGKNLWSVADSIDTTTAAGRLVLNVLMSVAQWERETIGERTKDALQHKKSNGERVGQIPYGYDLASDGRTLIENPEQQKVIVLMKSLRETGMSFSQIGRELEGRGIPTQKAGRKWTHKNVASILKRAS